MTDPTPVLSIHTATAPPLGADTWVHLQILANVDRQRFTPHVACATGAADAPTPTHAELLRIDGLQIVPVDFGPELYHTDGRAKAIGALKTAWGVRSLPRLARYIRRHRIRLLHTSDRPRDAAATVLLGRLTRTPTIVHVHVAYGLWMSRLLRWALGHADHLVAVSHFVAATLREAGIPAERIHVVHNAIDPQPWAPAGTRAATRAAVGVAATAPVVITVSRLIPAKGTEDLLRAFAHVRARHPDAQLLVVGADPEPGEPYLTRLRQLADAPELRGGVTFLGRRTDVPALMQAADVFALASFEEPFGLVFAEAMATGLPVVGLANGGAVEVVEHPTTGLLVAPHDVDALADAIGTLLDDPPRRAAMGAAGRARVAALFTTRAQADTVGALYARLLDEHWPHS